jgi:pullulanase
LFDALQLKLPIMLTMPQRVRAQSVGLSLVALAQGIPFIHAGSELLRSKSLDRNSYDSGDWFNRLDFTYLTNNWGVGLPPAGDNQSNWPLFAPLLADPALRPSSADILDSLAVFRELLSIRRSTPLFRLRTAADVQERVRLLNGGPDPVAGLVVMIIEDADGAIDRRHDLVAAVFNATGTPKSYTAAELASRPMTLHPIQAASHDPLVRTATFASGTFTVPGRTTAVFWSARPLVAQLELLRAEVSVPSLRSTLTAAIDALARGNEKSAASKLRAFIKEVEGLLRAKKIDAAYAAYLIGEAQAILGLL